MENKIGRKIFALCLVMVFAILSVQKAEAKWWIFGKSESEVSIDYIYFNKASCSEMNGKAVFFEQMLPNGMLTINGKAKASKGKIGSVMISLDGQETWEKAALSSNGTFEYKFTPQKDKNYVFYLKAIDTAGKTNTIEDTRLEFTLSTGDVTTAVKEAMNKLFAAYEKKNASAFMNLVSEDFVSGVDVLSSAVRSDFDFLSFIQIRYYINNISVAPDGKIFVSFRFDRSVVSSRTGQNLVDKGMTEFVLKNENGQLKLWSMKKPLMFGLSDAEELATGEVKQNEENLVLSRDGSIALGDVSGHDYKSGTITLGGSGPGQYSNYDFISESYKNYDGMIVYNSDFYFENNFQSASIKSIGGCNINSTPAPESGYYPGYITQAAWFVGQCYAVDFTNGNAGRAVLKMINKQPDPVSPGSYIVTIQYRYEE